MEHDHTRPPKRPSNPKTEVEAASSESDFTVEQDDDLDPQFMPQGFWANRRARKHAISIRRRRMLSDLIEVGMPVDSEHDFDPSTYTGRAGLRIATSMWWKTALILVILIDVAGWFVLLIIGGESAFSLALLGAVVAVPAALFYLLGRVPRS